MLPTQPDTFINVLLNVKTERLENTHGDTSLLNKSQFRTLWKYQAKFDCLVYEMLCIKERNPSCTLTPSMHNSLFDLNIPTIVFPYYLYIFMNYILTW